MWLVRVNLNLLGCPNSLIPFHSKRAILWRFSFAGNKTYLGLRVKCLTLTKCGVYQLIFFLEVPSAKFYMNPFSKSGAYTGERIDGLTGHDEVNGVLSWLSERA